MTPIPLPGLVSRPEFKRHGYRLYTWPGWPRQDIRTVAWKVMPGNTPDGGDSQAPRRPLLRRYTAVSRMVSWHENSTKT